MTIDSTWLDHFPALQSIDDEAWLLTLAEAGTLSLPAGVTVFHEGDVCQNYLLVLAGSVRVQKLSESGKEIVLYRVEAGQSCVLTTACLLSSEFYHAEAITETTVEAVTIPLPAFQQALAVPAFREFVFATYGERVTSLVTLIDAIAFGRMDARLARLLLTMADAGDVVHATHQILARELGTAREVVSRLLKEFERHGWLALQRGCIHLQQRQVLAEVADSSV
ncbi:MAG TPA: Crp/Fnr family transcriptional regulator [Gammaproteobacteria bacterium]|nr:Crp/Fnr family transcriptional regulator [Gammaproteobacteria bacterium]